MEQILSEILKEMDASLGWLEKSLARLDRESIWKRPRPEMNSVGNLCLHLAGNERHYIGFGVGGLDDIRDRSGEFNAADGLDADGLTAQLHASRKETRTIFENLSIADFGRRVATDAAVARSVIQTILHVSHHYSTHAGQVILMTRLYQKGTDRILPWSH